MTKILTPEGFMDTSLQELFGDRAPVFNVGQIGATRSPYSPLFRTSTTGCTALVGTAKTAQRIAPYRKKETDSYGVVNTAPLCQEVPKAD